MDLPLALSSPLARASKYPEAVNERTASWAPAKPEAAAASLASAARSAAGTGDARRTTGPDFWAAHTSGDTIRNANRAVATLKSFECIWVPRGRSYDWRPVGSTGSRDNGKSAYESKAAKAIE